MPLKKHLHPFRLVWAAYLKSFSVLLSSKLWWHLLVPLGINIFFLSIIFHLSNRLAEYSAIWLFSLLDDFSFFILSSTLKWLTSIFLKILYFLLLLLLGGHIVLMLLSPFLSLLSEQTESLLKRESYPFSFSSLGKYLIRGILLSLRNMLWHLFLSIVLFVLSFIPVIGFVSPLLLFMVGCYFYGFSFIDYVLERKNYTIRDSIRYVREHRWETIAIGLPYGVALSIPLAGILIGSFIAPFATVTACFVYLYQEENEEI